MDTDVVDSPLATDQPEAPPAEPTAEPQAEKQPDKPERTFTQKELDEIVQKRLAKESRRTERLARAEAELAILKQQQQPKPAEQSGEPQPNQFQDYESYIRAFAAWEIKKAKSEFQQESEKERSERQQKDRAQSLKEKLAPGTKKYDDFEDVVLNDSLPLQEPMVAAALDSDIGHEILYYLGNNLDEASRIAEMNPARQFRAILEIEAKLKAPPKPSNAPAPINPNSGNAAVEKDPSKMSDEEWLAWREKNLKRR